MNIITKVVADSVNPQGDRITSLEIVFPRIILAELNTHRILSKNSASSRAIPFKKMVGMVKENPFIPIAWQKEHKGMQGSEYFTEEDEIERRNNQWLTARNLAINQANAMTDLETTKQLANRLLEPFMMHKVLITGTEWGNFFELRCPRYKVDFGDFYSWKDLCDAERDLAPSMSYYMYQYDATPLKKLSLNVGQAEIHMMALAESIWDAMGKSTPKQLEVGEWHIPYGDKINPIIDSKQLYTDIGIRETISISTGMAARVSYTTIGDEKEVTYDTLIGIHNKMLEAVPRHSSPFEHCARAMSDEEYRSHVRGLVDIDEYDGYDSFIQINASVGEKEQGWSRNYKGWLQYRELIETGRQV